MVQFHDAAQKTRTTKGTKYHEGFCSQAFPSCILVALVVNDLKLHHYRRFVSVYFGLAGQKFFSSRQAAWYSARAWLIWPACCKA